jgi:hypothetical protein
LCSDWRVKLKFLFLFFSFYFYIFEIAPFSYKFLDQSDTPKIHPIKWFSSKELHKVQLQVGLLTLDTAITLTHTVNMQMVIISFYKLLTAATPLKLYVEQKNQPSEAETKEKIQKYLNDGIIEKSDNEPKYDVMILKKTNKL